jgi:hypothetical protein
MPFRLGALLTGSLLVITGCSGDEPRPASVDPQIRDGLAHLYAGDDAVVAGAEEGECFADELLARTSVDELRAVGLVDESGEVPSVMPQLEPAFAEVFVDAQLACTDLVEDSTEAQYTLSKGALDRTAYAACLSDAVDEEQQRSALVAAVSGSWEDPALAAFSEAQARCARKSGAG